MPGLAWRAFGDLTSPSPRPSATSLCCDSGMTDFAQRHKVVLVTCPSSGKRQYMMNFGGFCQPMFLLTHLAERMLGEKGSSNLLPLQAISFLDLWASTILIVLFDRELFMFLAVSFISQPWAARIRTGFLWSFRHTDHLFPGIIKALEGFLLRRLGFYIFATLTISYLAGINLYHLVSNFKICSFFLTSSKA